jgi:hypothetical protein
MQNEEPERQYATILKVRIEHTRPVLELESLAPGTVHTIAGVGKVTVLEASMSVDGETFVSGETVNSFCN